VFVVVVFELPPLLLTTTKAMTAAAITPATAAPAPA
jgi:hypothetical protein